MATTLPVIRIVIRPSQRYLSLPELCFNTEHDPQKKSSRDISRQEMASTFKPADLGPASVKSRENR